MQSINFPQNNRINLCSQYYKSEDRNPVIGHYINMNKDNIG